MNFLILKKACTFILTVSVFFSLLSISCTKKIKSNDNGVVFDSIQVNKTKSIIYKDSKLNCNLHILFNFPAACKKTSSLSDLQKIFIEKALPSQYANLSPQIAIDSFATQYVKDFQAIKWSDYFDKANDSDDDNDYILEDENSFIYELSLENKILYNNNNFISFVVKNTNYEGGSQGANSIYGYVIDLNTGKLLTEEDFAGNNYKKNLSTIIAGKIATAKGLTDASQLKDNGYNPVEDIAPNGNFTLDDKGITYYFNENEIAAGFVGIVVVFIPYEELKDYIADDSPVSSLVKS